MSQGVDMTRVGLARSKLYIQVHLSFLIVRWSNVEMGGSNFTDIHIAPYWGIIKCNYD